MDPVQAITDAPDCDAALDALRAVLADCDRDAEGEAVSAYVDLSAAVHAYVERVG